MKTQNERQAAKSPRENTPRREEKVPSLLLRFPWNLNLASWRLGVQLLFLLLTTSAHADEPPTDWIDPDTGHRVVRLSTEPGSASLYFHQNAYTPDGKKLIITTPNGISTIDLATRKIESIVEGRAFPLVTGHKTGQVYYTQNRTVFAVDPTTKQVREVVKLPDRAMVSSLNADETLLLGAMTERRPGQRDYTDASTRPATEQTLPGYTYAETKEIRMNNRLEQHIPMSMITIDTKTGDVKTLLTGTDWLGHLQFSPTDPTLIMFCHEGPWHKVDRIWTIRSDGTDPRKIHTRSMDMEIAGHEFFNPDGKIIWYDLQTPKSQVFWLAGDVLSSGETIRYRVDRPHWSVHFNVSPDGKLFAGDGGGPRSIAAPGNGQFIYLFTPEADMLKAEELVDLTRHDYNLEPNVTFTPDGRRIVFRSNMHGPTHVYAVDVAKAR
jgi:oligogalacturonide lyase